MVDHETTQAIADGLEALASSIEQRMREQGLTEDALASASGISPRTVGNFLRPNNRKSKRGTVRSFPSGTIANLIRIAKALDIEVWRLLCTTNPTRDHFYAAIEAAYAERRAAEAER